MLDRVKQIPARLLEIWNKYTKKQKTIIISIAAAILLSFLILIFIVGRTRYTYLQTFSDLTIASRATTALKDANIAYQVEKDSVTVNVDEKKYIEARYLLATDEFAAKTGFDREDLFNNSMSTTNADKKIKGNIYMQDDIANELRKSEGVDDAAVKYNINDDTIPSFLNPNKETVCAVSLIINSRFRTSSVDAIAAFVASSLGNKSTDSVTIIDQYGNLLYNGGKEDEAYYSSKAAENEAKVIEFITDAVVQTGLANGFHYVVPGLHLQFDYSQESSELTEYLPAEGQEQGLIKYVETTSSETTGAASDPVGTDSNDEESNYYIQNSGTGSSSYEHEKIEYTPSMRVVTSVKNVGNALFDEGSLTVTLNKNRYMTSSDWNLMPESQTMTLDEYLFNYKDPQAVTLSDEYLDVFAMCSGIPRENIRIMAYETLVYIPDAATPTNWDLILKIILAALILGLLIFVVFRGMAPVEVTELEPELSVEKLLATTKENQSLDDIEFSELSETRKLIEKFVDENPEAVANLLRTWLEDDWD